MSMLAIPILVMNSLVLLGAHTDSHLFPIGAVVILRLYQSLLGNTWTNFLRNETAGVFDRFFKIDGNFRAILRNIFFVLKD